MPIFLCDKSPHLSSCCLGSWASLVLDFCARNKVGGTHLTYSYLKQFPVLLPSAYTQAAIDFILPRVLELTYTSHDLKPWAEDLGYDGPPFRFDPERRALLRAELDAFYAHLYGLTRDELRYIIDPADVMGPDYPSETFRCSRTTRCGSSASTARSGWCWKRGIGCLGPDPQQLPRVPSTVQGPCTALAP
jgi:hypothetical protein